MEPRFNRNIHQSCNFAPTIKSELRDL